MLVQSSVFRTPNGYIYSKISFPYNFWKRYLLVFSTVKVIARVKDVNDTESGWLRSDGPNVSFIELPYYIGPEQYLMNICEIKKRIKEKINIEDKILFRVPSQIANVSIPILNKRKQRYSLEIVGDLGCPSQKGLSNIL